MENKEVERDIDKLVRKYVKNSDISLTGSVRGFKIKQYIEQLEQEICSALGATRHACSIVVERENNVKQLEQEIKELNDCIDNNEKSHLFFTDNQVKVIENLEKALDKACEQLSEYNYRDFEELQTKDDWKEWCMSNE